MATQIKSYHLSTATVEGELQVQGRYSVQKLLTNTVTRYYKTVEYNDGSSPSQYLIKNTPKNINSIYLYCTGFVRKYKLPTVSQDYQEYLTIYIADDQATYYLFQMECYDTDVYNRYQLPASEAEYLIGEVTNSDEDELCDFILKHLAGNSDGSDDGTALTIPDKFFFASETDRDDYFELHPEDLSNNPLYVVVDGDLQKYNATEETWESITPSLMGPKGEPGLSANISIGTVTTLDPSEQAYVQKNESSTEINSVFDFGIPKGEKAEIYLRGNYDSAYTYNKNDVVIGGDNNTYICTENNTVNIDPRYDTTHWMLLVNKGAKGDQGDQGPQGITPSIDPATKHWMIGTTDTGVSAEGVGNKWLFTTSELTSGTTIIPAASVSSQEIQVSDVILSQHRNSFNYYGEVTQKTNSFITVQYKGQLNGLLATIPDFQEGKSYEQNEIVLYNGILYRAKDSFVSTQFDEDDWTILKTKYISIYDDFKEDTEYSYHEVIVEDKYPYRCLAGKLTQSQFSINDTIINWEVYEEPGVWTPLTEYNEGDIRYTSNNEMDGIIICTTSHTSGNTFDSAEAQKWKLQDIHEVWQANKEYAIGNIVEQNYKFYSCVTPGKQSTFSPTTYGLVWEELGARAHQYKINLGSQLDGVRTSYHIDEEFTRPEDSSLILNGQEYDYNDHYTIVEASDGSTLTIKPSIPTPKATDRLVLKYWK
jgi:hypothetical protein